MALHLAGSLFPRLPEHELVQCNAIGRVFHWQPHHIHASAHVLQWIGTLTNRELDLFIAFAAVRAFQWLQRVDAAASTRFASQNRAITP